MPIYEYRCERCEQTFEAMQKFSDEPLRVHEGCGGAVERLLSPPALQFKGSGWYITDYARKSTAPSSEGKPAGNGGSSAGESKGESKVEPAKSGTGSAKPETKPAGK